MGEDSGRHWISNRYALLDKLGRGGMGTVWHAEDRLLERSVAVKEVHFGGGGEDLAKRVRRAAREARTIARVSHPNVVRVHDLVHEDERLWIVMELVSGQSLAAHLATAGTFSVPRAADIGLQLLDALQAVHAEGALHRDVKPANVLLRADGRAVLCDFGIAWVTDGEPLTSAGALIGSADVMAPERVLSRPVGPSSDLFSLGVTLCWLISGHSLFARSETAGTMYAVAYEQPRIPEAVGPLRPLVEALLRKDPTARPTPGQAADALRSAASDVSPGASGRPRPVPTLPDARAGAGTSRSRRRVLRTASLAAAAVVGGAGATGLFALLDDSGDGLPRERPFSACDAMLQAPGNHSVYWMFRGDRCVLLDVTDTGGGPRVAQTGRPVPLRQWAAKLPAAFHHGIDAMMPTPDNPHTYWFFSGKRYLRVRLKGAPRRLVVEQEENPGGLDAWGSAFATAPFRERIDAVLQRWNAPNEYWAFSGDRYVRLGVENGDRGYALRFADPPKPLAEWKNVAPGNRVDAVVPAPNGPHEYWVLSGHRYTRVRAGESHGAERLTGPKALGDWRP